MRNEHTKPLCHYPMYTQLKDMMAELASNVSFALEGQGMTGSFHDDEATDVEYRHRDGFIPFTDGGATCWAFVSCDALSNMGGIPAALQEKISRDTKSSFLDAMNVFLMEQRPQSSPFNTFKEANTYYNQFLSKEELCKHHFGEGARERFWEIERQQYEGFEYGIQYGVLYHAEKDDSLYFFVTVNTDAPYYRSNGAFYHTCGHKNQVDFLIHEESVSLDKLRGMSVDECNNTLEQIEHRLLNALWEKVA